MLLLSSSSLQLSLRNKHTETRGCVCKREVRGWWQAGKQACAPACICRAKFYPLGKMLVAVKKLAQTSSRISRRESLLVSEGRRRDKDKPSWGRHREEALSPHSATVLSTYDIYSLTFNAKRTSADDNLSLFSFAVLFCQPKSITSATKIQYNFASYQSLGQVRSPPPPFFKPPLYLFLAALFRVALWKLLCGL